MIKYPRPIRHRFTERQVRDIARMPDPFRDALFDHWDNGFGYGYRINKVTMRHLRRRLAVTSIKPTQPLPDEDAMRMDHKFLRHQIGHWQGLLNNKENARLLPVLLDDEMFSTRRWFEHHANWLGVPKYKQREFGRQGLAWVINEAMHPYA